MDIDGAIAALLWAQNGPKGAVSRGNWIVIQMKPHTPKGLFWVG